MKYASSLRRRDFLAAMGATAVVTSTATRVQTNAVTARPGRLKQAVCRGVFRGLDLDLEAQCHETARLGGLGVDLVGPADFPVLKKYGLVPTMVPGGGSIKSGINDPKNHAALEAGVRELIGQAAEAGAPNLIILAGDRAGISDEQGLDNCVAFLNKVKGLAEERNVTLCMELLNSKVNHPGYMCDHTTWGVEVCKRVNSPRVKLLYDIYHMQIMEGDVIRTIRENIQHIGHFHTAGNPGRHEFDETQELNYTPICRAIADLGFQGYVSHEYTPTKEPLETLDRMMRLCEV